MRLNRNDERRGVILMVVLALLTLFAMVGITFVLYAQAEATSARIAREGETEQRADMPPEECLAMFLNQLLYDVHDTTGYNSGLRGHSLARSMYGYNSTPGVANIIPFNGVGRLHTDGNNWPYMNLFPPAPPTYPTPYSIDDHLLVNYTWFPADGFARDPEWYSAAISASPGAAKVPGTGYYVGGNSPYTYPDLNNFFLAAVRSDGTVLTPSFHRPWLFNPGTTFNDITNPNWTNAQGKYLTLRPRPQEHPNFPYPDDAWGDVKNLQWAPGGNDSIWIDIGAPVMTAPDGTKYKMLVAPLIMDLDNRINLAAAGNIRGTTASRSNQGWFPSEMNLAYVLASTTLPTEWQNIFTGNGSYSGKYGTNKIPDSPLFPTGSAAHVYAPADLDGSNETAGYVATAPIQLPGTNATTSPANSCFPYFPPGYGSGSALERANHPAAYAVYKSPLYTNNLVTGTANDDQIFHPSAMERLLRPSGIGNHPVDTGSSALVSSLLRLCPQNLEYSAQAYQRRNWVTTVSNDLAKPGLSPWIYNPTTAPYAILPATPSLPPVGTPSPFPPFVSRTQALPSNTDFTANWRALAAALGRIDLNQPLPPFPHMSSGSTTMMTTTANDRYDSGPNCAMQPKIQAQFISAMTARQAFANRIYRALLMLTGVAPSATPAAPTAADLAPRRWLAQLAVNIVDYIDPDEISTPFNFYTAADAGGGGNFNIYQVTPTNSTIPTNGLPYPAVGGNPDVPTYWVFGTELPRIVINEVLGEYTQPVANGTFNVNVWVELFNAMPSPATVTATATANSATLQPQDALPTPLYMPAVGTAPIYNPYQLVISNNNLTANSHGLWYTTTGGLNNNVLGTLQHARYSVPPTAATPGGTPAICNFLSGAGTVGTVANPAAPSYQISGPLNGLPGQSFMLVGPSATDTNNDITVAAGVPGATPFLLSGNMKYQVIYNATTKTWSMTAPPPPGSPAGTAPVTVPIADNVNGVSVLLRRLANPHLPPNPFTAAGALAYPTLPPNPYITVDYTHGVKLNGYSATGPLTPPAASWGKLQPYAANFTQYAAQTTPMPAMGGVNHHSLGLQNTPIANPFSWLVHLDRKLISPMELLHVSGFHPHELTQRFIMVPNANNQVIPQPYNYTPPGGVPNSAYFQHYAPWFDQTRRLYRLFELLEAHDAASGVSPVNGRVPGKININTMWDLPSAIPPGSGPYLAIADPPGTPDNPSFTAANVNLAFQKLIALRSPGLALPTPSLSAADRPFFGMGAGITPIGDTQYPAAFGFPAGNGINHTLLTSGVAGTQPTVVGTGAALQLPVTNAAAPQIGGAHPYLQNQLLTKVYNNLTTRSNVFAVFLTVGFFEVTGVVPGSTIPQLGAEIGRSEGRQVRHRMFAIVDRTNMSVFTTTSNTPVTAPTSPSSPTTATVQVPALSGTNPNTGAAWSIAAGTLLVIEPGTVNEETVIVSSVTPANPVTGTQASFTANFLLQHPNPTVTGNPSSTYAITQRGNPGPWKRYSPRNDPGVVLYYNIID
jgi:hypothetical protein